MEHGSAPQPINPETGQHRAYWVLSEEERAKGFVRPLRHSYVHRGARPKYPTRPMTAEEQARHGGATLNLGLRGEFVAYEEYPPDSEEAKRGLVGRAWTRERLNSGCGAVTRMGQAIAETYARDPEFYGSTFCVHCRRHIQLDEFVWDGTDELVGS